MPEARRHGTVCRPWAKLPGIVATLVATAALGDEAAIPPQKDRQLGLQCCQPPLAARSAGLDACADPVLLLQTVMQLSEAPLSAPVSHDGVPARIPPLAASKAPLRAPLAMPRLRSPAPVERAAPGCERAAPATLAELAAGPNGSAPSLPARLSDGLLPGADPPAHAAQSRGMGQKLGRHAGGLQLRGNASTPASLAAVAGRLFEERTRALRRGSVSPVILVCVLVVFSALACCAARIISLCCAKRLFRFKRSCTRCSFRWCPRCHECMVGRSTRLSRRLSTRVSQVRQNVRSLRSARTFW